MQRGRFNFWKENRNCVTLFSPEGLQGRDLEHHHLITREEDMDFLLLLLCCGWILVFGASIAPRDKHPVHWWPSNHFDFFDTLQGVGNLWHCILWRSLPHLHFTLNPNPEFTSRPSSSASSSTSQICKEWSHLDCTIIIHQGNKICCPWIITMNGWSLISLWTLGYHTPTAADSTKEVEGHKTSSNSQWRQ